MNSVIKFNQHRLAISTLHSRQFSSLSFSQKAMKKHSQRIGKDYRTWFGCVVVVPEQYAILLHRFKKFQRKLEPGLNFKVPLVDTIEYVHDLRE